MNGEALKKMAEMAGVSEEQFLRVAGVLYLAEKGLLSEPAAQEKADLEKKIVHLLAVERTLSIRELENLLHENWENLEAAVQRLEGEGKVVTAVSSNVKIAAIANDGTLDLSSLPPEEREWMVVNAYGNRDKGLTYAKIHSFFKPPKRTEKPGKLGGKKGRRKEEVLQALKEGPKRRFQLVRALGLPEATVEWALAKLLGEGRVKKLEKGLYALADENVGFCSPKEEIQ